MTASSRARLLGLALLLTAHVAHADDPPAAPSEEQVEAGRSLYREARELERQGHLREALDKGLEAYRTAPTPVTALLAGQLLAENGRLVEARATVRAIAAMPASARETDKGREARQDAATLAAALDVRIPKIAVAGVPAGADVLLDGRFLGPTDAGAWRGVDPGAHALLVKMGERSCLTSHVTLAEGEERTLDLHGAAATCQAEAPAGTAPAPSPIHAPAPSPPVEEDGGWRRRAVAIGAGGVTALAVGIALAATAKHDYDSVASECPASGCDRNGYDVRNGARFRGDVATVVIGVGLAAILGGGVMWWLAPSPTRSPVSIGVGGVGLTF